MARFQNILYVTEEAVDQGQALEHVVSFATRSRSKLTVLDVTQPVVETREEAVAYRMATLENLTSPFRDRLSVHTDVRTGTTFLEVIRAVLRIGHDLVVKPAENPAFLQRVFGSTDMHLLRKCPCPVWMMKPGETRGYNCILAAVDFDPLNQQPSEALNLQILEHAVSLALTDSASLHLIHAWEPLAERTLRMRGGIPAEGIARHVSKERALHRAGLNMLSRAIRDRIGMNVYDRLTVRVHLPKGPAKTMIPTLAMGLSANLVVMGTVARTGIPGLIIGNTAEAILNQLTCSVLAVKPPGFTTPVKLDT
jgi:nucleotide-binding universal stress UspA family protein